MLALVELGWISKHGGHGHPLRPEYLITEEGALLAKAATSLQSALDRSEWSDLLLRKWSLPVLAALLGGAERFNAVRNVLTADNIGATLYALRSIRSDVCNIYLVQPVD